MDENDNNSCWKRPLLLMIPLRLGLDHINTCYSTAIFECFKLPQFVGILGGRPRHAVYFFGTVGDKVFLNKLIIVFKIKLLVTLFGSTFLSRFSRSWYFLKATKFPFIFNKYLIFLYFKANNDFVNQPLTTETIESSLGDEALIVSSSDDLIMPEEKSDGINGQRSSLNFQPQQRNSLFEITSSAGPSSEFVNLNSATSSIMAVATSSFSLSPSRCDIAEEENNSNGAYLPSSFRSCSSLN